ncbi:MAG: hypothetical protein AB8H47_10235 [Bacteroidia bacterium]
MKRFLPLLIITSFLWLACGTEATSEPSAAVEASSSPKQSSNDAELAPIPPAVAESEEVDRSLGQSELKAANIDQAGFQLNIKLPPGATVKPYAANTKSLLIAAEDGSFQIVVSLAEIAVQDLVPLWEDTPPVGNFRQFVINSRGGVLAEVEKEGKADYHVDYIFEKYRLHTPFEKSFSRMQASKVFNVCRQIQGLNR